ncbi:MAG: DUF881 domain-containing protein [Mycobacteriaceae bacterium]
MNDLGSKDELSGRHEKLDETLELTPRKSTSVFFGVFAVLLCAALGVAIATQVRGTGSGDSLESARPADLLVVLDTLHQREASLRQEITTLEQTLSALQASGSGSDAAVLEAQARLAALSIQVGIAAATGPGVILTITDDTNGIGPEVLIDQVQELRAAGAEAIEMRGAKTRQRVRIGVDSSISGSAGSIRVDDVQLSAPFTVLAIGDPPTLAAALNIPGGVVDTVGRAGGKAIVEQSAQVDITALREIKPRQYAQPGN